MSLRAPEPPDFPASQLFLRRLAYSLVRDEGRAEDLVQDTWAAWIEHRPSGVAEPKAWLARVLRNRAFNAKRSDARRARRESLSGCPDPSAPETDGTLEAQAQLIEALRKLEEPYRSTLVQRYYHDLAPKEIAERSGAPLNTVKARLARGLERLRTELDRRYGGDRKAWCHWLTVIGAPPAPISVPSGAEGAAGSATGGSAPLVGWLSVAAVVAAGAAWKFGWLRAPEGRSSERPALQPPREPAGEREPARVAVIADEPGTARESVPVPRPRTELAPPPGPVEVPGITSLGYGAPRAEDFEWPQYGGAAHHDNYRERDDEIQSPKVLWFVPGCAGQPTLADGELYTGGLTLARLDPETGALNGLALELLGEALETELDPRRMDERAALALLEKMKTFDPNDASVHTVAAAPVITRKLVLARRARDGGVVAFDRESGADPGQPLEEVWRWDSAWMLDIQDSPSTRVPLCLTEDGLVLVAQHDKLIALRADNGREAWRYPANGVIKMVPAAAQGRAFFGTDRGTFVALSASTGELLWQAGADSFTSSPVVIDWRVLIAGQAGLPGSAGPSSGGNLRAFNAHSGAELWRIPFEGSRLTDLGLGERRGYAVAGLGEEVARFELKTGERDRRKRIPIEGELRCAPANVGRSLVVGGVDGRLSVLALDEQNELRWAFALPEGAEIHDFVHTGTRIYLATSIGLFCLGDDPTQAPPAADFVLEWNGDPRLPSYLVDEK